MQKKKCQCQGKQEQEHEHEHEHKHKHKHKRRSLTRFNAAAILYNVAGVSQALLDDILEFVWL